jgi:hypothetical protein
MLGTQDNQVFIPMIGFEANLNMGWLSKIGKAGVYFPMEFHNKLAFMIALPVVFETVESMFMG